MTGEFAARIFNELLKGDACISQPTLKRACAHAEFLSDISQRRTLPGQRTPEAVLHLFAYIHAHVPCFKFGLDVCSDHRQQFFVVSHEGAVKITTAKNKRVAVSVEMHPAAEVAFKRRAILYRSSQLQSKRCNLSISAPATDAQNP